jgi:proline iminopeptidase
MVTCPFPTIIPKISNIAENTADFCVVSTDDVCICSHISGRGPLIVAPAPGWGSGTLYLQNGLGPYLEHFFTILYLTPRGTPPSTQPSDILRMSTLDMANDLETLRIQLGEQQLQFLTHSHGGSQAMLYAELFPQGVSKLALLEGQLIGFDQSAAQQVFEEQRANETQYTAALAALVAESTGQVNLTTDQQFGALLTAVLPYYFADPANYLSIFEKTFPNLPAVYAQNSQPEADAALNLTLVPGLDKIKVPTLLINGMEDAIVTPAMATAIHQGISGSQLLLVPMSGHFGWIEAPQLIIPSLTAFLLL